MKNFFFRILKWFKNLDICTKKSVPLSIYVTRYIYFSLLSMACILDWKHRQSQDIPGVYEAICIDELKRNFHAEYFIGFLVVILFYRTKVRPLPCLVSHCWRIISPVFSCWDLIDVTLACEDAEFIQLALASFLDLSNLLHGFVKVVTCISRPLPNKTKLKFDQDFE